jgi:hypothetical protein
MQNGNPPSLDDVRALLQRNGKRPVLLYIEARQKGPRYEGWQDVTFEQTQTIKYQRLLLAHPNTGVLLGVDNLCTIDCDTDAFLDALLALCPALSRTLRTHGSRAGQFWGYFTGNRPRKVCPLKVPKDSPLAIGGKAPDKDGLVQVGEFRAEGGQSVIRGIHPTGCPYQWPCTEPPITLVFEVLPWPTEVILPWQEKSRSTQRPGGGDAHTEQGSSDSELLQRAKERLSIDFLWKYFGFPERRGNPTHSPFREDKDPSFSVYDDGLHFKDHGNGDQGDSFDFYQRAMRQDASQAFIGFIELAGLGEELHRNRASEQTASSVKSESSPARVFPTLSDECYIGLLGRIAEFIEPETESHPAAILVQLLVTFGNLVGHQPYFVVEATHHYTNLFACLVGHTSKSRKGTSLDHIKQIFRLADPEWEHERFAQGLSSGEGLIWNVRDAIYQVERDKKTKLVSEVMTDPGIDDKRFLVGENEFAQPLRLMSQPRSILSTVIRSAWDSGNLRTLVKNSPARATDAHISIIGHITEEELKRELSQCEFFNGFANRFLWTAVKRVRKLPEGGDLVQADLVRLGNELRDVLKVACQVTLMTRDDEAREHWRQIYDDLSEGRPGMVGAATDRAEAQVLRLSMIYALADASAKIKLVHQEAALALWQYSFDSAKYLFGQRLSDPRAQRIWEALKVRTEGMTRNAIQDEIFQRNISSEALTEVLQSLIELGIVVRKIEVTGGRRAERYFSA